MTLCSKPVAEKCARDEGHTGECHCEHDRAVVGLGHALESLILRAEQSDPDFALRKAVRIARAVLARELVAKDDFERSDAEKAARQERRRAAAERDRIGEHDPGARARGEDGREEVRKVFSNLKAALPDLQKLFEECSGEWGYDDPLYRLYYGSFKVYLLQEKTLEIVAALQALAPDRALDESFTQIVRDGTGRIFQLGDNMRWLASTRPIVEAFFHARFFLETAVRQGQQLTAPPWTLPSGWAALLCLYELR